MRDGKAQWVACEATRAEWLHVLGRGVGTDRGADGDAVEAVWHALASFVVPRPPPLTLPRCSDPDDQKFVVLATQVGARWLVTRDRALLKLRRPMGRMGVEVVTPEGWNSAFAASEVAQQSAR